MAGFNRQHVQTSFFSNQKEAIDLLNEAPQIAIHLMLNEISKSARDEHVTEKNRYILSTHTRVGEGKRISNEKTLHFMIG